MSLTRRSALGLVAGAVFAPAIVRAQSYPSKTITLVVPYPAGGPTDAIARFVAQDLSTSIGMALATRDMMEDLRAMGSVSGGPKPFSQKDRSAFLQALDLAIQRLKRVGFSA